MSAEGTIHDLNIRKLTVEESNSASKLLLVQFEDHLLRRIGSVELVKLHPHHPIEHRLRSAADEVWVNIRGSVRFYWKDLRSNSPTSGSEYWLDCEAPTRVLAPFGVAFGFQPLGEEVWLIRLATHAENEIESEEIRVVERIE